ncbi:MAG: hypothetical protein NT027_07125 [Proteobacteria bacterium]|nr:hypothetical protein [Pseudomonadota bacterium]
MKSKLFLLLSFGTVSFMVFGLVNAQARESFKLRIERGRLARADLESESQHEFYLSERRSLLRTKIPSLDFPNKFDSFEDLLSRVNTQSTDYRNRGLHCQFLNKVRDDLVSEKEIELLEWLTDHGRICIASDISGDSSSQAGWSTEMHQFLWKSKWIRKYGANLSLSELVRETVPNMTFETMDIGTWPDVPFDATYGSMSQKDFEFVSNFPPLQTIIKLFDDFDFEKVGQTGLESLDQYTRQHVGHVPDVFFNGTKIWLSPSIGPADAVDTMVHEVGHIALDINRSNFTKSNEQIIYSKDRVLDETVAESFSLTVLRPLQDRYPEIEFSKVLKLSGLGQLKPTDPHFAGASSVHSLFASSDDSPRYLRELLKAKSIEEFLEHHRLRQIVRIGEEDTAEIAF